MARKIIYIINPISGARAKKNLQQLVDAKTSAAGIDYQIFPSVASGDYSFLSPVIAEQKITDVVIAGGDGTVSQVVAGLMQHDLNFGIIPCGSGNGLAYAAGIPVQTEKALDMVFGGVASAVDGFLVNDHFSCMLCGLGFDARVAHDFARQPRRGLGTYVQQAVKNFFSATAYPFEIRLKHNTIQTAAYFISIANSNQFGNNFTIAPRASLSDGLLDIVIATDQNKLSFLLQTIKQVAGMNRLQPESLAKGNRQVIYFQTDRLIIKNKNLAPLHVDGDPAETAEEFVITVKKKCFKLIQPTQLVNY